MNNRLTSRTSTTFIASTGVFCRGLRAQGSWTHSSNSFKCSLDISTSRTITDLTTGPTKEVRLSQPSDGGIRVNKCFKSFASRRESDSFIENGRVIINDRVAKSGERVFPGDVVKLDGTQVNWERLTVDVSTNDFIYIKHWKAENVACTTDFSISNNIIDRIIGFEDVQDRMFPVGRLDEASTGLILLTSDGRLPNTLLGAEKQCTKDYIVTPDKYVSDDDLDQLRRGVVITTVASRDRQVRKKTISRSLPCQIERQNDKNLLFHLQEGRNRQIRKMLGTLGYTTRKIHRIGFMDITLDGLKGPGDSVLLNSEEMATIKEKLQADAS